VNKAWFFLLAFGSVAVMQPVPAEAATTVSVAVVKRMTMSPTFSAPGSVVSLNDAHIASEVEGKVTWVANVGDTVKAGDPVAIVSSDLLNDQYQSDAAAITRLRATVRYDEAQADRMVRLAKAQAIAASQRDEAVSTRDADQAQLKQAIADAAKSKYALDHGQIRAPFPGRVATRLINPGEYATAGKDIVRLVDIDHVEVSAPAPISAVRYLKPATRLTMEIEYKQVVGAIRATVPVGDVNSRTIEVRIPISASDGVVGDAARVLIPSAAPRQVLAVSRDALVLREDTTYVFRLVKDNTVARIPVETGTEDGSLAEIKGDIQAGDRVVTRGAERLEDGETVRVAP
jgi:RND family efflux transporter MFP subunit